jgi:hypothetical protein
MENQNLMTPHKAEVSAKLSPMGAKFFKYIEFDDTEELLAEIRKHPIGAVVIGATGVLIALIIAISTTLLGRNIDGLGISSAGSTGSLKILVLAGGLILSILALAATALSVVIYQNNVIYLTNLKIAEVAYLSVFNRKITQLGLGSIEDVTFRQIGIFSRLFRYGTVIIETAGEVENCNFTYLPNPNFYSQKIIQAHEEYVRSHEAVR